MVLLGVVSLFADVTYEGARSITGPFLGALGASAAAVGLVAGAGELAGYGLRVVSGFVADRTRRFWAMTLLGYAVNLLAVPMLALAGNWPAAAALMVAERFGKAIRNPPRDAMLSHAARTLGPGWAFGLHEALDQVGAVLGPLIVAVVLQIRGRWQDGFAVLALPALLALAVLVAARVLYPQPDELATRESAADPADTAWPRAMPLYLAAVALVAAAYVDFPLVAYHLRNASILPDAQIPLLYAEAMAVDAAAALWFGRWFDRRGVIVLVPAVLLSCLFAPLVFLGGRLAAVAGMALWGVGMGAQESIFRAAIARMAPPERRASAYGLFHGCYGVAWFAGSAAMGYLYDRSLAGVVIFSTAGQILGAGLFAAAARRLR